MANETVLFKRGDSATITSTPVTDGQILFDTSGNGKMYLDNGTDRLEMGGALTVDATLSKTSTNPVQNKAVAGVMLDTLSDIGIVTRKGFLTDALAVKELNTNVNELNESLGGISFITEEGKGITGYTLTGADTVYPFSSGIKDFAVSYSDMANTPNGTFTFEVGDILLVLYIKQITQKVPVLGIESGAIIIKDQIQCGEGSTAMLVKVTDTTVKFTRSNVDHKGQYVCFNLSQN